MGIQDCLTCFLRNLYADHEAAVRNGHGATGWFKIGKAVCQGCILRVHPWQMHIDVWQNQYNIVK